MKNIISIENVTAYIWDAETGEPDFTVLKDITLPIEEGSFVAIIGRNGSGKTTLAKHMNALLLPTEGVVLVDGKDTKEEEYLWEIRRTCGMVFQNPDNQLVSSIVEDDVAFGPENMGVDPEKIRTQVDDALNAVDMYDYRGKAPHTLSGGQKQRVAIAGVVAMRPRCIVFDEPTAMLDPHTRGEVMEIIHRLHREGITVVLITHFMEEAAAADRVIIMNDGKITCDGTPGEVFLQKEKITEAGLTVPLAADIAYRLREAGYPLPENIVDADTLVSAVLKLKK